MIRNNMNFSGLDFAHRRSLTLLKLVPKESFASVCSRRETAWSKVGIPEHGRKPLKSIPLREKRN